jgi:hypothetical protein
VELELGDTLDITLPPDYVSYVRISYVNPETGELMFCQNENSPLATAYLQDHNADIYLTIMVLYLKVLLIF